jgi:hypothetical protein
VLLDAMRSGVLSAQEAWLIGVTRLEGLGIDEVAAVLGERTNTVVVRRHRAEHRLREAIEAGHVTCASEPDPVAAAYLDTPPCGPVCEPVLAGVSPSASNSGLTPAPFWGAGSPGVHR